MGFEATTPHADGLRTTVILAHRAQIDYENTMGRAIYVVLIGFTLSMFALAFTRPMDANASVAKVSPYTFGQTYGSALRLLRVDLEYKILERDKENGYILFEYTSPESGKKTFNGSIEFVETKDGVHIAVQIPQMPQYHEQAILDQLTRKLSDEHGAPPTKEKSKDKDGADKDKDAGKSKDEDKGKDGKGDESKDEKSADGSDE